MSQTKTTIQTNEESSINSQQGGIVKKKEKGKKQSIDPEYVKSPLTIQSSETSNRPASTTRSFKPFQKGGFISLLLCCTAGGSFLDNSDKSLIGKKKSNLSRTSSQQTKERHLSPIITNQIEPELEGLSIKTSSSSIHTSTTPNIEDNNIIENEIIKSDTPTAPTICLLPSLDIKDKDKKCLVLDLDETLVHSSFKAIPNPDFVVPVEIDNQYHNVYVLKRPGVDEFMRKMGEIYEIVVFTASLSKYADPVLDILDIHKVVQHRLFRESCFNHKGTYVKDLSQLGRELASTLILDNSPASYIFHPSNAVPVSTWFNDPHDTELTDLIAFLEDLTTVDDVQLVLDNMIDSTLIS